MRDGVDRNGRPSDFQLHGWLLEHYQLVEEVPKYGTVYIFKRRDLLDPARDPDLSAQLPPRPAKP
jgi:hypothetical protein